MAPPNLTWREIVAQATAQADILKQVDVMRNVQNILSTNASVASSLGQPFLSQITLIYLDMLNMYRCGSALLHSCPWVDHCAQSYELRPHTLPIRCRSDLRPD